MLIKINTNVAAITGFDSFRDDMRSSVHIDNKNKISW